MARHAIFADKGLYRLLKLLVDDGSCRVSQGGCGQGDGEQKGSKPHYKEPLNSE